MARSEPFAMADDGVSIRRARLDDLEALLDLTEAVVEEGRYLALEPPIDRGWLRDGFVKVIEEEKSLLLVAEADGEIVGDLAAEGGRRRVAHLGMCVAAPWRGKGVGSALLEACIRWAREAGVQTLALDVFPHNEAALALYRKYGFEEEGYLQRHHRRRSGELWDLILMSLHLDEAAG